MRLELVGRRRALVVAHRVLADLAEPDVRQQVDRCFRSLDGGEVAGEIGPAALAGRALGRDRSAFADHFSRHALADLAFRVAVGQERVVGVRVRVDEAGREDQSARVDRPRGGPLTATDGGDPSVADRRPIRSIDGAPVPSTMRALVMRRSKGRWLLCAASSARLAAAPGRKTVSSRADYIAAGTKGGGTGTEGT